MRWLVAGASSADERDLALDGLAERDDLRVREPDEALVREAESVECLVDDLGLVVDELLLRLVRFHFGVLRFRACLFWKKEDNRYIEVRILQKRIICANKLRASPSQTPLD